MARRSLGCAALRGAYAASCARREPGFQLVDVTSQAGIHFQHNSGAYGGKLLPETLGSGCAFLDYDADGWQDILLVNAMDWPGHKRQRSTLRLYRNNRNGTFADVTKSAGLDIEMYGMGVAVGDYNNDGFPDILITCVGQNRLFRNTGKGTFVDATQKQRACRAGRPSARRRSGSTTIATACSIFSSATTCAGRRSTTSSAAWMQRTNRIARRKPIAATPAGCFTIAATARLKM